MSKTTVLLLGVLIALGVAAYLYLRASPARFVTGSTGPTVTKLQRLSELVTTRVEIADVLVADERSWRGWRGYWLVRGDALISVDLERAIIVERDEAAKTAVVRLPRPTVLHPRVDFDRTRTWSVEKSAWVPGFLATSPDALRDHAMRQAQRLVQAEAGRKEVIDHARRVAETVIPQFYEMVGWHVTVVWEDGTVGQQAGTGTDSSSHDPG